MRARLDTDNLIEGETIEPPANGHNPESPTIIAGGSRSPRSRRGQTNHAPSALPGIRHIFPRARRRLAAWPAQP